MGKIPKIAYMYMTISYDGSILRYILAIKKEIALYT